jgi:lipopolysaccharide export system permease protein
MLTLLDRYVFSRYLAIYVIAFLAVFGLFAVLDGFTNVDAFQQAHNRGGLIHLLWAIGERYFYQGLFLFDLAGTAVAMVAMVSTLAMIQKNGELNPVLAAGIPTYRLAMPFIIGITIINAVSIANQEFVIPRISSKLQIGHGEDANTGKFAEPVYDQQLILFSGEKVILSEQKLINPLITLPTPMISQNLISIRGTEAVYFKAGKQNPAGWLIKQSQPKFSDLQLTPQGQATIRSLADAGSVFIVTDVTLDQLANRNKSYKFLATVDLYDRIVNQKNSPGMTVSQLIMFHSRLTKPLLNLVGVFLVLPLIVRKESHNLLYDMFVCISTLTCIMMLTLSSEFIARSSLISPEQCAWLPVIVSGFLAAWFSVQVRS